MIERAATLERASKEIRGLLNEHSSAIVHMHDWHKRSVGLRHLVHGRVSYRGSDASHPTLTVRTHKTKSFAASVITGLSFVGSWHILS
jgi:hypothetical protein